MGINIFRKGRKFVDDEVCVPLRKLDAVADGKNLQLSGRFYILYGTGSSPGFVNRHDFTLSFKIVYRPPITVRGSDAINRKGGSPIIANRPTVVSSQAYTSPLNGESVQPETIK